MNGCIDMRHSHNKGRPTGPVDEKNSDLRVYKGRLWGDENRKEMLLDIAVFAVRGRRETDCLLRSLSWLLLSSHPQRATR